MYCGKNSKFIEQLSPEVKACKQYYLEKKAFIEAVLKSIKN